MKTLSKAVVACAFGLVSVAGAQTHTTTLQNDLYLADDGYIYTITSKKVLLKKGMTGSADATSNASASTASLADNGATSTKANNNNDEASKCTDSLFNMVGLNVGVSSSSFDSENSVGSVTLSKNPDESFNSVEVFATLNCICKKDDVKPYVSYTQSKNDDIENQYVLVGLNKYYNDLYAGVLVGYGELTWKYNPLTGATNKEYTSKAPMVGLQVGMNYGLSENLYLNLNLKGLYHDYETEVIADTNNKKLVTHEITTSGLVGIAYKF